MQASFLGRSAPGANSKVQRGGSGEHTNGGRSFIFGSRDDSNLEAPPAQQPAEVLPQWLWLDNILLNHSKVCYVIFQVVWTPRFCMSRCKPSQLD